MAILVRKQNRNMISGRKKKNTKFLTHKYRAYYKFEETFDGKPLVALIFTSFVTKYQNLDTWQK